MPQRKRRKTLLVLSAFFGAFLLLGSLPTALAISYHAGSPVYRKTFYGAFLPKYDLLRQSQKKKVVVLGTSSVAFGVESALLEEELSHAGMDADVIGYGLYGALGTRLMMETALPHLEEGDTVLFSPELNEQTLSNYFSVRETYRAIENDTRILKSLSREERTQMILGLPGYLGERNQRKEPVAASGVYAADSFDEHGDMVAERPENIMPFYYDLNNPIRLDMGLFSPDFVSCTREYAEILRKRGVSIYFRFCPLNQLGLEEGYRTKIDTFAEEISKKLSLPILGDPHESILKENWFYDSSFHLNSSGAKKNTLILAEQLKLEWGRLTENLTPDPAMPELPIHQQEEVFGDDSDAECFEAEPQEEDLILTGVKANFQSRESLILPTHIGGSYVTGSKQSLFDGCSLLKKVRIQENIPLLYDRLFASCPELEEIHLSHLLPSALQVGWNLLEGAPKAMIYVPKASLSAYQSDYFWSHYAGRLVGE